MPSLQSEREPRVSRIYQVEGNTALEEEFKPRTEESVGYDLSRFDQRPRVREVRRREAASPRERQRAAERPRVSAATLILGGIAALCAVLLLYNEMQMTVLNDQIDTLKDEYTELVNQGVKLRTQYESRYDLTEIEEYAQAKLGMTKMDRSQMEYVEIGSPDTITRRGGAGSGGSSLSERITDVINRILALFS